MAVSKKTRFEVFKRDSFTCRYCGQSPPAVKLEADHVIPKAEGGPDDPANLVTSCEACNRGKGARGLGDTLPPVDEMLLRAEMQEALERAHGMRASLAVAELESRAFDESVDAAMRYVEITLDCTASRQSIARFVERMPVDELYSLVRAAHGRLKPGMSAYDRFRYFCGVCWKRIRESSAA